jgi:hypothetical protein
MKKQFLLLAGSAVLFASCGSNNNNQAQTQAQIDSAVNAGVQKHDAENAAKNDSVLKAMEKEKADAMTKEHQSSGGSHKPGHKTPAAEPAPPPVQTVSPVNNRPGAQGPKSVTDRPGAH